MNTALMIRPLSKYKVNQQKTKNEGKKKGGGDNRLHCRWCVM